MRQLHSQQVEQRSPAAGRTSSQGVQGVIQADAKVLEEDGGDATQQCAYTKCHWTSGLKMVKMRAVDMALRLREAGLQEDPSSTLIAYMGQLTTAWNSSSWAPSCSLHRHTHGTHTHIDIKNLKIFLETVERSLGVCPKQWLT